ncbi:MAG: hypothetical protein JNM56_20885 [Planctomycetia bacterium]|nr:hypothetical protein [Planctomycetia bacterium]
MTRFPKSTWIGAALFDLVGFAAIVAGFAGKGVSDLITISAGASLMACSGLLFVIRMPALLLACLSASLLLMEFAHTALNGLGSAAHWPEQALTLGGIVVLFFAAAAFGGGSTTGGGCCGGR